MADDPMDYGGAIYEAFMQSIDEVDGNVTAGLRRALATWCEAEIEALKLSANSVEERMKAAPIIAWLRTRAVALRGGG